MIKLDNYSKEFEQKYLDTVKSKVCGDMQKNIILSCQNYMPNNFFNNGTNPFEQLILAPFSKLKSAYKYLKNNKNMEKSCFDGVGKDRKCKQLYADYQEEYRRVVNTIDDRKKLSVRMVEELNLSVCPYCNREYINSRADNCSGAQLDHFYSKSDYPIFSLSLYNLVPVCGNCNRIKNNKKCDFASPFDEDIEWDSEYKFTFPNNGSSINEIKIDAEKNEQIKNNIKEMKIEESYQIHIKDVNELQKKIQEYSGTQIQEIIEIFDNKNISESYLKKMIFGQKIDSNNIKKISLGRMMKDLYKIYNIYD